MGLLLRVLFALALLACAASGARAQQCIPNGGYPWIPNGCWNAGDFNSAFNMNPAPTPPRNNMNQGAGQWKFWLDTSTAPPTMRQCIKSGGCTGTSYVAAEWTSWATIDPSSGSINLSNKISSSSQINWANVTSTPTTLSGYGISDALNRASNLGDLQNPTIARGNLGLGTLATQNATAAAITGGTVIGLTNFGTVNGTFSGTLTGVTVNVTGDIQDNGVASTGTLGSGYVHAAAPTFTQTVSLLGQVDIPGGDPTFAGRLRLIGNSSGINTEAQAGGIELKSSNADAGYGYKLFSPDLLSGNTPLILAARNNSADWTDVLTIDGRTNFVGIGTTGASPPGQKLDVRNGNIRTTGELISTNGIGLRIAAPTYGAMLYNDNSTTYFLLTAANDVYGSWNTLRPLAISDTTGYVAVGNGMSVINGLTVDSLTVNNTIIVPGGGTLAYAGSTLVNGQCLQGDVNGHIVSTGSACGTGGGGGGGVSSVGLSGPGGIFSVSGSPITGSGTIGLTATGVSGGVPYFSGANTLSSSAVLTANALVMGGGAGTAPSAAAGLLYSGGNLGVGGITPSARLHVLAGAPGDGIFVAGSGGVRQMAMSVNNSIGGYNALVQAGDQLLLWQAIASPDNANSGGLVIGPWSASAYGVRITYQGDVGVGTASPIHVSGYGSLALNGGTGGFLSLMAGNVEQLRLITNNSGNYLIGVTGLPTYLYTNNTSRVTISTAGQVGIGMSPGEPLDVHGIVRSDSEIISTLASGSAQFRAVAANYGFMILNDNTNTYFLLTPSSTPYGTWNALRPLTISDSTGLVTMANGLSVAGGLVANSLTTSGAAAFTGLVSANGNVGIGPGTVANNSLQIDPDGVHDNSRYGQALQITRAPTAAQYAAFVKNGVVPLSLGYKPGANVFGLGVSNATDSAFLPTLLSVNYTTGGVGINNSAPGYYLDVNGNGHFGLDLDLTRNDGSGTGYIVVNNSTTTSIEISGATGTNLSGSIILAANTVTARGSLHANAGEVVVGGLTTDSLSVTGALSAGSFNPSSITTGSLFATGGMRTGADLDLTRNDGLSTGYITVNNSTTNGIVLAASGGGIMSGAIVLNASVTNVQGSLHANAGALLTGGTTADSLSVTGALAANSLSVSGTLTAGSFNPSSITTGSLFATSGARSGADLDLTRNDSQNTGFIVANNSGTSNITVSASGGGNLSGAITLGANTTNIRGTTKIGNPTKIYYYQCIGDGATDYPGIEAVVAAIGPAGGGTIVLMGDCQIPDGDTLTVDKEHVTIEGISPGGFQGPGGTTIDCLGTGAVDCVHLGFFPSNRVAQCVGSTPYNPVGGVNQCPQLYDINIRNLTIASNHRSGGYALALSNLAQTYIDNIESNAAHFLLTSYVNNMAMHNITSYTFATDGNPAITLDNDITTATQSGWYRTDGLAFNDVVVNAQSGGPCLLWDGMVNTVRLKHFVLLSCRTYGIRVQNSRSNSELYPAFLLGYDVEMDGLYDTGWDIEAGKNFHIENSDMDVSLATSTSARIFNITWDPYSRTSGIQIVNSGIHDGPMGAIWSEADQVTITGNQFYDLCHTGNGCDSTIDVANLHTHQICSNNPARGLGNSCSSSGFNTHDVVITGNILNRNDGANPSLNVAFGINTDSGVTAVTAENNNFAGATAGSVSNHGSSGVPWSGISNGGAAIASTVCGAGSNC